MAQMLPYILPLLLGRTFDLDKMQVGIDIFPKDVLDRKTVIQNPVTNSHYKIVDNTVEARDLLDVEGSFSLNVKGGLFKAGASGAYLADTYNRENTVEVVIKATYQTVTEQLPTDAKPYEAWQTFGSALGTHFVRSITYGGEIIASVRMECNNTKDKQKIKAALEVGGQVEIFDLGVEAEGEYMKDVAKSVESTQIKIFSSIPLSTAPSDMDALKKALDDFPEDLSKFNNGRGIPLKMELWPLKFLDSSRIERLRNRSLEATLDSFEQKFDDLLNTKKAIADWMKVMAKPLSQEHEKKVGDFYEEVQKALRPFYDVIGSMDMTKDCAQLQPALQAYGNNIPGIFYKQYMLLRQEIAKDQGDWTFSKGNGVIYVHWGKKNCSEMAEQISEGTVIGPSGKGGGGNFLCLPDKSHLEKSSSSQKDVAVLEGISFKYPNDVHSQLYCSTCRLASKGSVEVFSGITSCPENWDYIYDGLLMSGLKDLLGTSTVCLDKTSEQETKFLSENSIVPNWALHANNHEKHMLFPCVVCSK